MKEKGKEIFVMCGAIIYKKQCISASFPCEKQRFRVQLRRCFNGLILERMT